MVFQHFSLFEALTAAENIALSLDDGTPISTIAAKAKALSYSYGLPLDPYSLVGDLSVGERQRIEIIRCLLQTPQLIILDEPTSVLTPQEADKLFETLERLRSRGQVDPLHLAPARRGEAHVRRAPPCCGTARWSAIAIRARKPPSSLARMMVGNEVQAVVRAAGRRHRRPQQPLLEIRSLSRKPATPFSIPLKNINLNVRAGEVIGIAGVAGNGQGEFFEAVSGEVLQQDAGFGAHPRQGCRAALASPGGACWARPSCRKSGSAMARRRA